MESFKRTLTANKAVFLHLITSQKNNNEVRKKEKPKAKFSYYTTHKFKVFSHFMVKITLFLKPVLPSRIQSDLGPSQFVHNKLLGRKIVRSS